MNILFIGDVVGEPGRRAVRQMLPRLRQRWQVDFVVVNAENAAGGAGITPNTAAELFSAGADVLTTGDHVWDHKEIVAYIESERRLLRPLNYPPGTPGRGSGVFERGSAPAVAVVNVQGRVFMPELDNPFSCITDEIARLRLSTPVIVVDMHAEATSEKIAIARMLDGRVSAVVGTHTHVQTADEQVFPGGTAYLTDAGFTGPHESVLGRRIEPVIKRFTTLLPQRFDVATGHILIQGALINIDEQSGRALGITRVSEPLLEQQGNVSSGQGESRL
ncbi:MAG TPA: TIGR00282 family metallophosphoesterase [Verrucomicrobiota bacterium]|nr:TIGR00282 family metallophosphoesterase [Verrucomicrobiota bacterium]HOK76791.1 TIGR00282 family metallophosphoesterase [Verrucomicrobiota bacterium]